MLVAPKYAGIEIPVLSPETEIIGDIRTAEIDQTQDKIIRASEVTHNIGIVFNNLVDYLEAADKELTEAAKACKAEVVPHSWGLYKLDPNKPSPNLDPFRDKKEIKGRAVSPILPENYILVSEVAVVKNASSSLNLHEKDFVIKGIENYKLSKKPGDLIYEDNHEHQYASGIIPQTTGGKRALLLMDIEPIIVKL